VPGCEVVVPVVAVPVVPGDVVPGWDCVDEVPVCVPIPGLGVTEPVAAPVPVACAAAMPTDSASTDEANKILRIELPLLLVLRLIQSQGINSLATFN
jgi:hypothetical protein